MTDVIDPAEADRALKARHRSMWAMGNYNAVATEVIPALGPVLVEAAGVKAGDRVLDIAAGSGNASLPAARAGAKVVASDLTPELLELGRQQAEAAGLEIDWQEADAEALPYADGEFDVVLSLVGIMFAPHHQQSADELARVTRGGGRIGLISWTPEGFIGQMFATMKPYAPPPPPGASPPPLWGREEHVRELLGDRVSDVKGTVQSLRSTPSPVPRISAITSSATTARRWRSTSPSARMPTGSLRWTVSLPTSRRDSASRTGRRQWSGSTCSSPRRGRSRAHASRRSRLPLAAAGPRRIWRRVAIEDAVERGACGGGVPALLGQQHVGDALRIAAFAAPRAPLLPMDDEEDVGIGH